jgi:3-hydroxyisobutyrate dehydrogenase-like beta-hydroxyacid dehydrogenase
MIGVAGCGRMGAPMLGGDTGDLDNAQPLFDAMGAHFHRMGGFGRSSRPN